MEHLLVQRNAEPKTFLGDQNVQISFRWKNVYKKRIQQTHLSYRQKLSVQLERKYAVQFV